MHVLVAGFQHETNTFAPTKADWAAFCRGDTFPARVSGAAMIERLTGVNLPAGGFLEAAGRRGWMILPSCWAGATPSAHVTRDAFERLAGQIVGDAARAVDDGRLRPGRGAVYLDLHGAAVAEHVDDCEGELIARVRAVAGPRVPIVASLDLHANVTGRMLAGADALVAYRTYPHVDMAATGQRAALLLERCLHAPLGAPAAARIPFLIPIGAQSTMMEPGASIYRHLAALEQSMDVHLSFTPGFPIADFPECGPVVWGYGARAAEAVSTLAHEIERCAHGWTPQVLEARDAVTQAMRIASGAPRGPVVIADAQDNPGAGGDSDTTGLLHALLAEGAGRRFPGRVAIGLIHDAPAARAAHAAGAGAVIEVPVGRAVPTFTGRDSDAPVRGAFRVAALSDGAVTLAGAMMTGLTLALGPCARLEIEGVSVLVASGKAQLLDRELFRFLGVAPEAAAILAVKSSVHFRADFAPIADTILVAKAAGPVAVDPADLPWRRLAPGTRTRPIPNG